MDINAIVPKEKTSRKLLAYYINLVLFLSLMLLVGVLTDEAIAVIAVPVATALSMLFGVMVLGNIGEHFAKKGNNVK